MTRPKKKPGVFDLDIAVIPQEIIRQCSFKGLLQRCLVRAVRSSFVFLIGRRDQFGEEFGGEFPKEYAPKQIVEPEPVRKDFLDAASDGSFHFFHSPHDHHG
jgi:hypothetical protein